MIFERIFFILNGFRENGLIMWVSGADLLKIKNFWIFKIGVLGMIMRFFRNEKRLIFIGKLKIFDVV